MEKDIKEPMQILQDLMDGQNEETKELLKDIELWYNFGKEVYSQSARFNRVLMSRERADEIFEISYGKVFGFMGVKYE